MRLTAYLLIACLISPFAQGRTLWKADFETANTGQWHWIANPEAIRVSSECSFDGKFSGKITLSGDPKYLWNGQPELNRSEFHYTPEPGSTHEGKETFYAFSFYLPEAFTLDGRHELGYWESDKTWQQMMRFNIQGEDFSFKATAQDEPFWIKKNGAKAKQWHKVAMHIFWSTDPKKGTVEIWLDGEHMGKYFFQTLTTEKADMFNQLGILRNQQEKVETIYIDKVFATDNLTELLETDAYLIGKGCR
jgi:Polysaccharide lyase